MSEATRESRDQANGETRARLLEAARAQFAARGFHGASLALIAGELGVTKQALLYHFRSKEDLYAEVLKDISDRLLTAMRERTSQGGDPAQTFESMIMAIEKASSANPLDTRVLMHELLDHKRREAPPEKWYFKTFLDELVAALDAVGNWKKRKFAEKLARIYLLISAIEYFAASSAVLARFYGDKEQHNIAEEFRSALRAQLRQLVGEGQG